MGRTRFNSPKAWIMIKTTCPPAHQPLPGIALGIIIPEEFDHLNALFNDRKSGVEWREVWHHAQHISLSGQQHLWIHHWWIKFQWLGHAVHLVRHLKSCFDFLGDVTPLLKRQYKAKTLVFVESASKLIKFKGFVTQWSIWCVYDKRTLSFATFLWAIEFEQMKEIMISWTFSIAYQKVCQICSFLGWILIFHQSDLKINMSKENERPYTTLSHPVLSCRPRFSHVSLSLGLWSRSKSRTEGSFSENAESDGKRWSMTVHEGPKNIGNVILLFGRWEKISTSVFELRRWHSFKVLKVQLNILNHPVIQYLF